jgi:hypothetical protein
VAAALNILLPLMQSMLFLRCAGRKMAKRESFSHILPAVEAVVFADKNNTATFSQQSVRRSVGMARSSSSTHPCHAMPSGQAGTPIITHARSAALEK